MAVTFIVALLWHMHWQPKYNDSLKKYPKIRERLTYKGLFKTNAHLLSLKRIFEVFKNSHPEDKRYSYHCRMLTIGYFLIGLFFLVLFNL